MLSVILKSPCEIATEIAQRAKARRLQLNWSQRTLSERSGVSYGTLKQFERSGKISLESLLKIALALEELPPFDQLFNHAASTLPNSIDDLFVNHLRKRGRR